MLGIAAVGASLTARMGYCPRYRQSMTRGTVARGEVGFALWIASRKTATLSLTLGPSSLICGSPRTRNLPLQARSGADSADAGAAIAAQAVSAIANLMTRASRFMTFLQ